jgi:uncharacterized membrane protein YhaH (DUF805 family)
MGTAFLLATIVGSGIMAERLAGGNEALALLCNSTATGAMLVVLIAVFGPVSDAHFNPAVTLVFAVRREIAIGAAGAYVLLQLIGAVIGTWTAHLLFGETILQLATKARETPALWFAEGVATFGLILTIRAPQRLAKTLATPRGGERERGAGASFWQKPSTEGAIPPPPYPPFMEILGVAACAPNPPVFGPLLPVCYLSTGSDLRSV